MKWHRMLMEKVMEERVIERESVIRLSQKDARKVLSLLDNPPKPNKRLKDAVKQFKATKINPKGI
jgi:uncharacterized protein (DUF1778 family)